MAVGVGILGMLGGFGAGRLKVFLICLVAMRGADEVGLARAYLARFLEDISESAVHLPGRAGTGPRYLAESVPALQLQVFNLFLPNSCPNLIKFALGIIPTLTGLVFDEYSSLHLRFASR
jgi:hypothetical protein